MALQIDVVSDIVCPWCFIGKRQLHDAMLSLGGPSDVRWHPMQLYPEIPDEGASKTEFLATRFGGLDNVEKAMNALSRSGAEHGIRFDFDRISTIPNTLAAHQLVYASPPRLQSTLVDNLFSGFFERGLDLSDRDVLISLAEASELEPADAAQALDDEATREAVLSEQARLKKLGLSGIPNILLNRRLSVSGAQDAASLVRAFDIALFGSPDQQAQAPVVH